MQSICLKLKKTQPNSLKILKQLINLITSVRKYIAINIFVLFFSYFELKWLNVSV